MRKFNPVTPGELLLEEFLKPLGLSQYRLAKEIGVPAQRISSIVAGDRAITADRRHPEERQSAAADRSPLCPKGCPSRRRSSHGRFDVAY